MVLLILHQDLVVLEILQQDLVVLVTLQQDLVVLEILQRKLVVLVIPAAEPSGFSTSASVLDGSVVILQ